MESAKPKVDHPSTGSKDIADAVACANWICIEDAKKSNFIVPTSNFDEILLNYKLRSKMKLNNPSLLNNSTNIVGQIMSNIYQEENDQTGNNSK
ncbi:MAG: hypothetical protein NZZ41_07265 [Candidatus Dojkabacteria bacterium]|nr:hypothetical protein [Candidatus Dojkabacteria bacterium]